MSDTADDRAPVPGLPRAEPVTLSGRASPVARIVEEMVVDAKPKKWLEDGENRLVAFMDDYTARLGVASVKKARERNRNAVDSDDVEAAEAELVASPEIKAFLLALGGLFGGAGAATAVAIILASNIHDAYRWWIAVSVLGVVALGFFVRGRPTRRSSGK